MRGARLASYDLVRKIAAGGMAEIFLARQWGAGGFFRDVVVKRLYPHLGEHERQVRMFQDEARLLSQLSHPNIPQVYDVGFAEGVWYSAMEFVDGFDVADLWRLGAKAGQVMPVNVALALVIQACDALHHAHERKDRAGRPLRIVHRDVTPQNVMVTRDGVVKLMDFGVASTSARKDTEVGVVRGTLAYMAPEQVRGRPLDKRADVFALGVVLYELTTGTRLFRGNDVQVMTQVVEQDAPPPSSRVPGYLPELEQIVLATLTRERGSRIPSAGHLGAYLEELATRYGWMVGPRAVARYMASVAPAEPIREEALAMVAADAESDALDGPPSQPPQADVLWSANGLADEVPEAQESASLVAVPVEAAGVEGVLEPIDLDALELEPIDLDALELEGEGIPDPRHARPPLGPGSAPETDAASAAGAELSSDSHLRHEPLVDPGAFGASLDPVSLLLESAPEEHPPILLLDQRSRKDASERPPRFANDYVAELERRLADESDDV